MGDERAERRRKSRARRGDERGDDEVQQEREDEQRSDEERTAEKKRARENRPVEPRAAIRMRLVAGAERDDIQALLERHGFSPKRAAKLADRRFRQYQDELRRDYEGFSATAQDEEFRRHERNHGTRYLITGVVFAIGGGTGTLALRGTNSSALLFIVGLVMIVFGLVKRSG